jgi:hypothetical protein
MRSDRPPLLGSLPWLIALVIFAILLQRFADSLVRRGSGTDDAQPGPAATPESVSIPVAMPSPS